MGSYSTSAPDAYVDVVSIWMFFAMTGLNVYTLAGYAFLLATGLGSLPSAAGSADTVAPCLPRLEPPPPQFGAQSTKRSGYE